MTQNTGDSLEKPRKKGTFAKGFDPRRNIRGVPKDALLMRKHMRQIAAEIIGNDETAMTRLDAMLRQLFTSRNPAHNKLALQVLDPRILQEHVDVTSGGEKITEISVNWTLPKAAIESDNKPTDPA
jgi:hypothetical protein